MIHRIAVLGAGVMGAQIAAHCVNAGFVTLLFDVPAVEGEPNGVVLKALATLKKLKPAPQGLAANIDYIIPANYAQHLELLADCDLIIEAVAERLEIKTSVYTMVAPWIKDQAYLVSNTSGLSITALATALPAKLQQRFCGVHFFNPPRYMTLAELIPHAGTAAAVLDTLESFLTTYLGKGVIRAKDTPNFIANRIGVFALLSMIRRAMELGIPFEVVDALAGVAFGRAKSAVFRTLDVVGLDVLAHAVQTMDQQLGTDPWHSYYALPDFLHALIEAGRLGQKSGAGVYRKQGADLWVWDCDARDYRLATQQADLTVLALLQLRDPAERLAALRHSDKVQAQFLWLSLSDVLHYSAYHLEAIAENVRDVDLALRWGFGWQIGIFELWQQAGWSTIRDALEQEPPLPAWVHKIDGPYQEGKAYAPGRRAYVGCSGLAVYQRQLFPDPVFTEVAMLGDTLLETAAIRLWTLDQQVAILSFKTKKNTISEGVLDGILAAVSYAEQHCQALVIWQSRGVDFSLGADLSMVDVVYQAEGMAGIERIVEKFQQATQVLRYSRVPTVAAVRGLALGGGCEMVMHCTKTVAAFESYLGLVEAGVGLLPAGAGCKAFALRAWQGARGDDPYRDLVAYFKQIARGEVSSSASDAKARGFLNDDAVIVMHPHEVLMVALTQAKALAATAYLPPLPPKWPVIGIPGIANLQMLLFNQRAGDFISEYDAEIGLAIATILCGGAIDAGCVVDEAWFLRLEREAFYRLVQQPQTQARIRHLLKTGQILKN